jgi:hypothetical protein
MKVRDEGIEKMIDITIRFPEMGMVVNASWQRPIHTAVSHGMCVLGRRL